MGDSAFAPVPWTKRFLPSLFFSLLAAVPDASGGVFSVLLDVSNVFEMLWAGKVHVYDWSYSVLRWVTMELELFFSKAGIFYSPSHLFPPIRSKQ